MILPNSNDATSQSRLSRWFSVRRGSSVHQYDIENVENSRSQQPQQQTPHHMPNVNEVIVFLNFKYSPDLYEYICLGVV